MSGRGSPRKKAGAPSSPPQASHQGNEQSMALSPGASPLKTAVSDATRMVSPRSPRRQRSSPTQDNPASPQQHMQQQQHMHAPHAMQRAPGPASPHGKQQSGGSAGNAASFVGSPLRRDVHPRHGVGPNNTEGASMVAQGRVARHPHMAHPRLQQQQRQQLDRAQRPKAGRSSTLGSQAQAKPSPPSTPKSPKPVEAQPSFRNHQPTYPGNSSPKTFFATSVSHPSQQRGEVLPSPHSRGRQAQGIPFTGAPANATAHAYGQRPVARGLYQPPKMLQYRVGGQHAASSGSASPAHSTEDLRSFEASELKFLQENLLAARRDLIDVHKQLDVSNYKLSGALMSINYFWAPELDKFRKRHQIEKQQREAAEVLLKEHEIKARRQDAHIRRLKESLQELLDASSQRDTLHNELQQRLTAALNTDNRVASDVDNDEEEDDDTAWIDPSPLLGSGDMRRRLSHSQAQVGQLQLRVRELEEQLARQKASTAMDGDSAAAAAGAGDAREGEQASGDKAQAPFASATTASAAASAASAIKRLEAELAAKTEAVAKLEERVQELDTRVQRSQEETTAVQSDADALRADRERLLEELEQMTTSEAAASEELSEQHSRLQSQVEELTQQLQESEKRATLFEQQRDAARSEAEQLRTDASAAASDHDAAAHALKVELSEARAAVAAVKEEKEDVLARAEELEETIARARAEAAAASDDMHRKLQAAEEEREELRERCSALQAQVDEHSDLEAQLSSLEEDLEEARSAHRKREEELQGQLADLHREAHAQQDEIRHLQRDLAAARARDQQQEASERDAAGAAAMKAQNDELTRDVERLETSLNNARDEITQLSSSKAATEAQLRDVTGKHDKLLQQHNRLRKRLEELESENQAALSKATHEHGAELAALRLEMEAAANKRNEAEANARGAQRREKKALQEVTEVRAQLEEKAAKVDELTATNADIKKEMRALRRQLSSQRDEVTRLQQKRAEAEQQLSRDKQQLSDKSKQQEASMSAQKQQMAALKRKYAALEKEKAEASTAAASARAEVREMGLQLTDALAAKQRADRSMQSLQAQLDDKTQAVEDLTQQVRDLSNKIIFEKINVLLLRIEDKDSRIAALEHEDATRHRDEIERLRREQKEELVALKEQYKKRQALEAYDENGGQQQSQESRETLIETLEVRQTEARRFRRYIDSLLGEVLQQDGEVQTAIMTGLPRLQQDEPSDPSTFGNLTREELDALVKRQEDDNSRLEKYINDLLQRIVEHRPSILEVMAFSDNDAAVA